MQVPVVCSLEAHEAHEQVIRKWDRNLRQFSYTILGTYPCPGYDGESRPVSVFTPDKDYHDWPGRSETYFAEGYALTENEYDGRACRVQVTGSESGHGAAYLTLDEMRALRDELDRAIDEQVKLVQKWAPYREGA